MPADGPIGIFDSGVGGLCVRREILARLPGEDTIYLADQLHVPYGNRTPDQLRELCDAIAGFLLEQGCKAIVVACNTASAAALHHVRERCAGVPAFGMEPAVKPAAAATRSGVVGIMATPATFQGELFKATAGRYASAHRVITQVCDGLVEQVEAGRLDDARTDALLERYLQPMLAAGTDTIVLACTHYSFLAPAIRRIAGPDVDVIDPAPAVARHVRNTLEARGLLAERDAAGAHRFLTTGDAAAAGALLARLVGLEEVRVGRAELPVNPSSTPRPSDTPSRASRRSSSPCADR